MQKSADFRHTPHGSPQTTNVYEKSAPNRCSFNNICLARIPTVVIVWLSSNMSCISYETRCKYTNFFNNNVLRSKKLMKNLENMKMMLIFANK